MKFITPDWKAPVNVKALTSTRGLGVSLPPYGSLNLGDHVGDDGASVEQNRRIFCEAVQQQFVTDRKNENDGVALEGFEPQWIRQTHTTNIVNDRTQDQDSKSYDGQFTQNKGVICAVMTADCMPVFICNKQGSEIALVHAGWKGFADGIVEKAIKLFTDSADQLLVHCGPAISQENFEIGNEVKALLGGSDEYFRPNSYREGHCYADLSGLLGERMRSLGVTYTCSQHCTFAEQEQFFSYRREAVTGRMVSLLWLE